MAASPQSVTGTFTSPRPNGIGRALATPLGRLTVPSLSDLFFIALLTWLFVAGGEGWKGLLLDGDCGWHIRTGETILDTGKVPWVDPYSFTRAGQPWFAWEWLSDVLFALLFRWAGLKGVVLTAGVVIATFATVLLRRIFAQGANLFIALLTGLLAVGAASIHYLARPHIFTLLFLVSCLWILEADRQRESRRVWLLVPLMVLWTNLHGGFLVFLLCLGALAVGSAIETWMGSGPGWRSTRRYAGLTAACAAASIVNPYGLHLHLHIVQYLRSDWIRNVIQEFQSPSFRSESILQFEALLFLSLIVAAFYLRRRRVTEALWIIGFAHLALSSVRHVPIFVTVAAPLVAGELTAWWTQWSESLHRKSSLRIIEQMGRDLAPGFRRGTFWPAAVVFGFALMGESMHWPTDFPSFNFPTRMVAAHPELLAGHRVFTHDQWGDYLIFNDPRRKVFIDGRSDFYGPELGNEYLDAMNARWPWRNVLEKYAIDVVLAPVDWPLASVLKVEGGWRVVADDSQAVLFARVRRVSTGGARVPRD